MTLSAFLEDFSNREGPAQLEIDEMMLEELKLEAFEKGYQAGWDDSAKSQADSKARASAEFHRNLEDLSFTYHEAYTAMLSEVRPLLRELVASVLPNAARQSLGLRISELVEEHVAKHGKVPIHLTVSPADTPAMANLMEGSDNLQLEIVEDDTLVEGQVRLGFGEHTEREVNMADMLAAIEQLIDDFFDTTAPDAQKESA